MTSDGSAATAEAHRFLEAHLPQARALGTELAALVDDPDGFAARLRTGLAALTDPAYAEGVRRVAPTESDVIGVRVPLLRAVRRPVRAALRRRSPASAISLAQHLVRAPEREIRNFAIVALERTLADDPERTWQLIRMLARAATDWIAVDELAPLVAEGILREPRRWAELEQLVYSPNRWERRLVGSTIASMPFQVMPGHRDRVSGPALTIIESLIGDDEPEVQKALSWALRSWREVDPAGVAALLERQTERAIAEHDGHRAWVVRDAHTGRGASPREAAAARRRLAGVRRRPGAAGTSTARETVIAFLGGNPMNTDLPPEGERMQR